MTKLKHLTTFLILSLLFCGCDSTKNIYKSQKNENSYFTIKAETLTHCGCTHLYVDHFKNGKKDFDIFYNNNVARKTIITYDENKKPNGEAYLLATKDNNFTTAFDSLDLEIFKKLDSLILHKVGFVYSLPRPQYLGYIKDPYLSN